MFTGMLLGLAASTNFLAIIAYLAFAARRYLHRGSFDLRADGPFHVALIIFAAPGLIAFAQIVGPSEFLQIGTPVSGVIGISHAGLGFFGGYRIGPIDIALGIPYLALLAFSLGSFVLQRLANIGSKDSNDLAQDLFIIFAVMGALCVDYSLVTGFSAGRAWLFLAPFLLACFAFGYWCHFPRLSFVPLVLASFLLFTAALANGRGSDAPYKRNLVIPFHEVTNFVEGNANGSVLYVSQEPVGAFLLRDTGYCLLTSDLPSCAEQPLDHFDTIVLIDDSYLQKVPNIDTVQCVLKFDSTAH